MSKKTKFLIEQNELLGYSYVERLVESRERVASGNVRDLENIFRRIRFVFTGNSDPEGGVDFRPIRDELDAEIARLRAHLVAIENIAAMDGNAGLSRIAAEALAGSPEPRVQMGQPVRKMGVLPGVNINITKDVAEQWDNGLSDILCWSDGFNAALGNDHPDRRPMGIEALRRIRETLSESRRAAESTKS